MFVGSIYNRYNKDKRGYKDVCMWLISVVCGLIVWICFNKVQRIRIKAKCRTKCKKWDTMYTYFISVLRLFCHFDSSGSGLIKQIDSK